MGRGLRGAARVVAGALVLAVGACNAVTGASSLVADRGEAADASAPTPPSSSPPPVSAPDAGGDGADRSDAAASFLAFTLSAPTATNLTTEGTIDWIYLGYGGSQAPNRKMDGGSVLSDLGVDGGSEADTDTIWSAKASWSDGTPTASASNTTYIRYVYGAPSIALRMTAPASLETRTLVVQGGVFGATAEMELALSDGSMKATQTIDATSADASPQKSDFRLVVTYRATPGVDLSVTWTLVSAPSPFSGIGVASATLH